MAQVFSKTWLSFGRPQIGLPYLTPLPPPENRLDNVGCNAKETSQSVKTRCVLSRSGLKGNLDYVTREIFPYGIWNPGLWDRKFSSRKPESRQLLEIRNSSSTDMESVIQYMESRIQGFREWLYIWQNYCKSLDGCLFVCLFVFFQPRVVKQKVNPERKNI